MLRFESADDSVELAEDVFPTGPYTVGHWWQCGSELVQSFVDETEFGETVASVVQRDRQKRVKCRAFSSLRPDKSLAPDDAFVGDQLHQLAVEASRIGSPLDVPHPLVAADAFFDFDLGRFEAPGGHPPSDEVGIEPCPIDPLRRS